MPLFTDILAIVAPVFLVILLGHLLRRWGLIDAQFLLQVNRLVYYVCLPLLLFHKIGNADFAVNFNATLVGGSMAVIVAAFALSFLYAALRRYPPSAAGSFCQGSFRGNLAYMGLAIVFNAYGEEGLTRAGILMGFLVPLLNLLAILALLLPHRSNDGGQSRMFWMRQVALNPLILASFIGILWSYLALPLPLILDRSLNIATGMTLPLALIAIGGSFSLKKLRGDLVLAALATTVKIVLLPLLTFWVLRQLSVTGLDLAVGVLIAGTPAATANYIMAHQLKGDPELSGSIVMMSTLLSSVSYTVTLYLLRSAGL